VNFHNEKISDSFWEILECAPEDDAPPLSMIPLSMIPANVSVIVLCWAAQF
jgi:hypothetical protein